MAGRISIDHQCPPIPVLTRGNLIPIQKGSGKRSHIRITGVKGNFFDRLSSFNQKSRRLFHPVLLEKFS